MRTTDPGRPGWVPPHCPNRNCLHHNYFRSTWRWRRRGSYVRPSDRRRVPRLECRTCGVTFSTQTFSPTYWLKRPDLPARIFMRLVGCMGDRQIARDLDVAPETVTRHIARLGRHCMLYHMRHYQQSPPVCPVVIDGFESFEYSQYHPFHHHLAVEVDTGFWLWHTDSELRRKGRMTEQQRKRRDVLEERHGRPDPQSIRRDVQHLLEVVLAKADRAVIRSDDHKSYPPAIRAVPIPIRHEVTSSKLPRTATNPLFPVNEADLLIRHSQSNHKRETIAFSKRRQSSAGRLMTMLVWRNYVKRRREKGPRVTAAMLRGTCARPLKVEDVLERRLFAGRIRLPGRWQEYYDGAVETREIPRNRRHELKYAY